MFIELTKEDGKKVLVDVEKIAYVEEMDSNTLIVLDAIIEDYDACQVEVVESVEQIKAKLL